MKRTLITGSLCFVMVASAAVTVMGQTPLRDRLQQRFQTRFQARISPYIERDRWLDVTEWFDGNNYNPTNEVYDRLSDRAQRRARLDARTSADVNFGSYDNWYGYDSTSDARWFYDYYDHGYYFPTEVNPQSGYRYYDSDRDGYYDTYTSYYDRDRDGQFDDESWYTLDYDWESEAVADERSDDRSTDRRSDLTLNQSVSGKVVRIKETRTPMATNTVIELDGETDQSVYVDLGPVYTDTEWSIDQGDEVTAEGSIIRVGDKPLLLADRVVVNNETYTVRRSARTWDGIVVDTRKTELNGQPHTMAIVYTPEKERVLVDLGPSSEIDISLRENTEISISGMPMKIKDRPIIMAHQFEYDGEQIKIDRVRTTIRTDDRK